jgi:CarboxypepD_reg-like domain
MSNFSINCVFKVCIVLTLLAALQFKAQSNYSIEGTVCDSKTKEPLANATVYLSQTTNSTITNNMGHFVIQKIPKGKFNLVAVIIGYEPKKALIEFNNTENLVANFMLDYNNYEMKPIEINAESAKEWNKQLKYFKKLFLGNNEYADDCVFNNELKLDFQENDTLFSAVINEPLIIINNALGYKIECVIKGFSYNKIQKRLIYIIYPVFKELKTSSKDSLDDFKSNRSDAYRGSSAQLLSLLTDENHVRFKEAGFKIYYYKPDLESQSYYNQFDNGLFDNGLKEVESSDEIVSQDSLANKYYLNPHKLSYDRIGIKTNKLLIKYRSFVHSLIDVFNESGTEFYKQGYFTKIGEYSLHGSMADEGIATMLPSDYQDLE